MHFDFIYLAIVFAIAFIIKKMTKELLWLIPTSMLAGFLGLLFSKQILGFYQFQGDLKLLIDLFLAVIFGTFPLTIKELNISFIRQVKNLWVYSVLQYLIQWGGSLLLTILLFKAIWPIVQDSFGLMLPSGFAGGHGSAAVVGDLLMRLGDQDALNLSMTMATIGAFFSVVGGTVWIFWATKKGHIQKANFHKQDQGKFSFSALHIPSAFILIIVIALAMFLKPLIVTCLKFDIPIFVVAVAVSFIGRLLLKKHLSFHAYTLGSMSNLATDLLVCVGIASIELLVVYQYMAPIFFMSVIGITSCILIFLYLTPKMFPKDWFQKGLFTWGWSVGGLVFALALVRMITSKDENAKLLQQFAMTYILLSPIEISLLLSMPYFVTQGYGLIIAIFLILLALVLVKLGLKSADK
jgi:glutamate:Na+ symporter, ESS family